MVSDPSSSAAMGVMRWVSDVRYSASQDGRALAREEEHGWVWVLRDRDGRLLDKDLWRAELAQRNGLTLLGPCVAGEAPPENEACVRAAHRQQEGA